METILFTSIVLRRTLIIIMTESEGRPDHFLAAGVFWKFGIVVRSEVWDLGPVRFITVQVLSYNNVFIISPKQTFPTLLFKLIFLLGRIFPHNHTASNLAWGLYDALLPNTYIVKMENHPILTSFKRDLRYLYQSINNTAACILIGLGWVLATKVIKAHRKWQIINVAAVILILLILLEDEDWMPGSPFLTPFLPFAFLVFAARHVDRWQQTTHTYNRIFLMSLGLVEFFSNLLPRYSQIGSIRDYLDKRDIPIFKIPHQPLSSNPDY